MGKIRKRHPITNELSLAGVFVDRKMDKWEYKTNQVGFWNEEVSGVLYYILSIGYEDYSFLYDCFQLTNNTQNARDLLIESLESKRYK